MLTIPKILACIVLALPIVGLCQSTEPTPQGWLWYRDHPQAKPTKKPPPQATPVPVTAGPAAWSTAWIRDTLPRLLDLAVAQPTPENVRAYLALQRLSVDRAQAYAEVATMVTQSDPNLDENSRFPTAAAAAQDATTTAQDGLVKAIQELSRSAGLYFFFRSDCVYCHKDLSVLRTLQLVTGIKVTAVSIDGIGIDDQMFPNFLIDNGQAQRLGVQSTPAFFLVRPDVTSVVEIGQGFLSLDQLETRIVEQAYYRHWINTDYYNKSRVSAPMFVHGTPQGNPGAIQAEDITAIQAAVAHLPTTAATTGRADVSESP